MNKRKAGRIGAKKGRNKRRTGGEKLRQKASKKASPKVHPQTIAPLSSPEEGPTLGPRNAPGGKIFIDKIDRDTVVGDLIVVFPWTKEVLQRYGLRLDVEEAGDIYITLEAFAAVRNLKPDTLVRELTDASRQPPQPPQPASALITASPA